MNEIISWVSATSPPVWALLLLDLLWLFYLSSGEELKEYEGIILQKKYRTYQNIKDMGKDQPVPVLFFPGNKTVVERSNPWNSSKKWDTMGYPVPHGLPETPKSSRPSTRSSSSHFREMRWQKAEDRLVDETHQFETSQIWPEIHAVHISTLYTSDSSDMYYW